MRTVASLALAGLTLIVSACGSSTLVAPSPVPPQAALPIPVPTAAQGSWLSGYTLTSVSLSGVVYEETPTGRVGIAGAHVYCELCGEATHTWARADANGVYRFPEDAASGGGVWLRPGNTTAIGISHDGYQDPPGVLTGWRHVMISGDTRFDIQLVRR